jgi:hypothetical protein
MAMRRLSAAVNFFDRAVPASLAIADLSLALSFFARARPPNVPSATAAAFFFFIETDLTYLPL